VWQGRRGDPSPYADCVSSVCESRRVKGPFDNLMEVNS